MTNKEIEQARESYFNELQIACDEIGNKHFRNFVIEESLIQIANMLTEIALRLPERKDG